MSAIKKVTVVLDKERTLIYDLAALKKFEELTGKSSMSFWNDLMASDVSVFIYVGLLRENPDVTQEWVDGMIDLASMTDLMKVFTAAYFQSVPDGVEEGEVESSIG